MTAWTRVKPTQEGWYWFRPDRDARAIVVFVFELHRQWLVEVGPTRGLLLERGEWSGPLDPPIEPEA